MHYVAGLSLDDVDHFGLGSSEAAENLAKLKSWLRSEAWEPWHANIVRAIGLLGEGSGDMNLLLEYASSPGRAERLSYAEYGARQEAFISAGDVVARTIALDKTDMVSRLITRAQPSYWLANPPDWTSPYEEPASFIAQHLARLALIGLGYTRTRKAEEFLGPLAKDAPVGWTDPVDREFQKDVGDIIQEARERNGMLPR